MRDGLDCLLLLVSACRYNALMNIDEIDSEIDRLQRLKRKMLDSELSNSVDSTFDNKNAEHSFPCTKSGNLNVVIVGGAGQIGQLFLKLFIQSGYRVSTIEKDDWDDAEPLLADAALVLIAVPINLTVGIIENLSPLSNDCVLADVTSIKEKPMKAMLLKHLGPVVGLHPMFGPDVKSFSDQTVIVCEGRLPEQYQWLVEQLKVWKALPYSLSAQQHDRSMAMIQVMRHFSTVAYGYHLMKEDTDLSEIIQLSSPIYRLELAMVGRLFAQDPQLYSDIIFSNLDNVQSIKRYIRRFEQLLDIMEADDKQGFIKIFNQTSDWFGEYATQFLAESSQMLENTHQVTANSTQSTTDK